jgi:hypothetical protein
MRSSFTRARVIELICELFRDHGRAHAQCAACQSDGARRIFHRAAASLSSQHVRPIYDRRETYSQMHLLTLAFF